MKRTVFVIIILLLAPSAHAADDWSAYDIARETTWQAFNLIDRSQTLRIPDHPELEEANPNIDPTNVDRTNTYFVVLGVGHAIVSHKLSSKWRKRWQMRFPALVSASPRRPALPVRTALL